MAQLKVKAGLSKRPNVESVASLNAGCAGFEWVLREIWRERQAHSIGTGIALDQKGRR